MWKPGVAKMKFGGFLIVFGGFLSGSSYSHSPDTILFLPFLIVVGIGVVFLAYGGIERVAYATKSREDETGVRNVAGLILVLQCLAAMAVANRTSETADFSYIENFFRSMTGHDMDLDQVREWARQFEADPRSFDEILRKASGEIDTEFKELAAKSSFAFMVTEGDASQNEADLLSRILQLLEIDSDRAREFIHEINDRIEAAAGPSQET